VHSIDFTKIRSNIFARDENVHNHSGWENSGKAICMVSPYSLRIEDENKLNNYISLFNHLVKTFRIFYKIKIITESKHFDLTLKNIEVEQNEIFILDSSIKVKHGNPSPRQFLFSTEGIQLTKFECKEASSFIDKGLDQLRSSLPDLDNATMYVQTPHNLSFNEFCVCDNFILISKALEDKNPSVVEDLKKFFNFENVVTFSAPDNQTNISRYFRSLDSVAPINYGDEKYIVTDNPQLIYSFFDDKELDGRIEECLSKIEKVVADSKLSLDKIKFNNFVDESAPNALDFSILDSVFLLPLYNAEYHKNYDDLAAMYPNNYFLSVTHPNLNIAHDVGVEFSNIAFLSNIL